MGNINWKHLGDCTILYLGTYQSHSGNALHSSSFNHAPFAKHLPPPLIGEGALVALPLAADWSGGKTGVLNMSWFFTSAVDYARAPSSTATCCWLTRTWKLQLFLPGQSAGGLQGTLSQSAVGRGAAKKRARLKEPLYSVLLLQFR